MKLQLSRSLCSFGLVLWFCVMAIRGATAQEKVTIQLDMPKGDSRKVNFMMNMDNKISVGDVTIDMTVTMGMDMTMSVTDVDNEGLHTVDFTYDRIKLKMTGPLDVDFDSAKKDEDPGPLGKVFGALAGQTITLMMDRQAKVKDVKGFDKLAEKLGVPKQQLESQREQMTQMLAPLPGKPVGIGDSWEGTMKMSSDPNLPATVTAKYTLVDRKDGDAVVKIDGKIKSDQGLNGTMSGTMRIEEKSGWTKTGDLAMTMKGKVQGGADVNMTAKMKFRPTMQN